LAGLKQLPGLLRNKREQLVRRRSARYQRGHAPQRGLLINKLTRPCLARWLDARPRVGGMTHVGAAVWRVHEADGSPTLSGPAMLGAVTRGLRLIR
jgi:hypothetical protein